jgi:hypothetical protein
MEIGVGLGRKRPRAPLRAPRRTATPSFTISIFSFVTHEEHVAFLQLDKQILNRPVFKQVSFINFAIGIRNG